MNKYQQANSDLPPEGLIFCFAIFFDSIENVERNLWSILSPSFNEKWTKTRTKLDSFENLRPYFSQNHSKGIKCLIWRPYSNEDSIVAFFTTVTDGWITLLNEYFAKFGSKFVHVTFSGSKVEYPIYKFEYFRKSGYRILQTIKDPDKWDFFMKGKLLPFEKPEKYKNRLIKNRLDNEIISEYLEAMGVNVKENDFWLSDKDNAVEFCVNF